MKQHYIVIICLFIFSCSEKTIQLPETTNKDIVDIKDVSSIYMFYNELLDSLEFNRKNMISTTNWLVAVDKRLQMEKVLPHLIYLQDKRFGDGVHKNKDAGNYFACSNTIIKNLSFIEFTDIIYSSESFGDFVTNLDVKINPLIVSFNSKDSVSIDSKFLTKSLPKTDFIKTINSTITTNQIPTTLFLCFNNQLTFQDYIDCKSLMLDIKNKNINISAHEFIYN